MEEVDVETNSRRDLPQDVSYNFIRNLSESSQVIPITTSPPGKDSIRPADEWSVHEFNDPQDAWLPITESRKGNTYLSTFHVLSSGIGVQALLLPLAFSTFGW